MKGMVIGMNKVKNKVTIILMLLLATTLLCGCGLGYVVNSGRYLRRSDGIEFTVEKEKYDQIKKIDIHTSMGNIDIIPSDAYYVDINYLFWVEKPYFRVEDGVLYFDDSKTMPISYSINFNLDNSIKIYIPEEAFEDVSISTSSGDIDIEGLATKTLDLSISYGDLTIKNSAAAKADIDMSSGNSKISDFQVGKLEYANSYGDASFKDINLENSRLPENTTFDKFNISMSSGNVDISELITEKLAIANSYGNVTCDKIVAEEFDASLSSGDLRVKNSDIIKADVDNSYGDATLRLLGTASDYSLDLDTSYGVIKVDHKEYEESMRISQPGPRKITASLSSGDIDISFEN